MIKLEELYFDEVFEQFHFQDLNNYNSYYNDIRPILYTKILNNYPKKIDKIKSLSQESLRINKHNG